MTAPSVPGLQVRGLSCQAGDRVLFQSLNLALSPGQCLILTGRNGSGKSTLLRAIAGLIRPVAGEVFWQGDQRSAFDPIWHSQLIYQGHHSGFKDLLSAQDNLRWQLRLDMGPTEAQRQTLLQAIDWAGLTRQRSLPFARLSAGQRRRLALARLYLSNRPLWLLDEPLTALDGEGQMLLAQVLHRHLEAAGLVIAATHQGLADELPSAELSLDEFRAAA